MWTVFAHAEDGMNIGDHGHMMNGDWSSNGGFMMICMFVVALIVTVGAALLLSYLKRSNSPSKRDDSIAITKARYAKGEISKEEFDEIKQDLK